MPAKTDATKLDAFLEHLADGHAVKNACKTAGIGRRTVYDLRESDQAFADRWREAEDEGVEVLEQEARRRAVDGVEDFKVGNGELVPIRRYSDTLLIFLLKAKRPGVYREHFRHEHTGADGGPLVVELAQVRERLTSRLADRASRKPTP